MDHRFTEAYDSDMTSTALDLSNMGTVANTLALLLFLPLVSALNCQNFTLPIQIAARNGVFSVSAPQNAIDVTNFALALGQQGQNYSQSVLQGYETVTGSYNIAATHCAPDGGRGSVLQILTHGIGFDRSYWDLPFNDFNYSYVATAVERYGYSTLTWDRLGIGMSSHGDPVAEIQAPLEQAALVALTQYARSYMSKGRPALYSKVVHVGHSFGSILTYSMAHGNPSLSDGLVLTAFAQNGTFFPFFNYGANLIPATTLTSDYEAGYLAAGNEAALQTMFFAPGQFDPSILPFTYSTAQPVAIGELLTIGGDTYRQQPVLWTRRCYHGGARHTILWRRLFCDW